MQTWLARLLRIGAAVAVLAACRLQAAGAATLDACALAQEPARRLLGLPLQAHDLSGGPPGAGMCELRSANAPDSAVAPRLVVLLYTDASMVPDGQSLPDLLRLMLAEAEATSGGSEASTLTELTETAAVFGFGAGNPRGQVIVGERGVVLELSSENLGRERTLELTRLLWARLLVLQPTTD